MIIKRVITPYLLNLAEQFPAVAILGPRQSGKTTLAQHTFPNYKYVSLEELDNRKAAQEDPRSFFATYENAPGLIIDEMQRVPELFSYLQGVIDKNRKPGFFIITGSQNFLLHEKITQSLAGRIAMLTLLPLSTEELEEAGLLPQTVEKRLARGAYPILYATNVQPSTWLSNYVDTYVEKDVRQLLRVTEILSFQRFIKLCAARIGNIINYAELARDCDISPNTAKAWLSVLETSYIIKTVAPYHQNFSKRMIKSPKLYFYDSGLVCTLLGIKSAEELYMHPMRGAIFESFVVSEVFKTFFNQGKKPAIYFWRDVQGHEVDIIIEKSFGSTVPIEVKARRTITEDIFRGMRGWQKIANHSPEDSYIVYAGDEFAKRSVAALYGWNQIKQMLSKIGI